MLRSNPSTSSLYGTDIVSEEHKTLVECVSKHVLYYCTKSTAIMSTNALAFLLLNRFRNGTTTENLVVALDELREELSERNKDLGFSGDSLDVIYYAMDILGPGLIRKERDSNGEIIKPVAMLPNVIELSYYSNTLIAYFAMDAVVATALLSLDLSSGFFEMQDLKDACLELCDILHYEFIFSKPCHSLEAKVLEVIDHLQMRKEIFHSTFVEDSYNIQKSKKLAKLFEEDSDDDYQSAPQYKFNEEKIETVKFLRGLLLPLVEAYTVTASSLDKLVGRELLEKEFINEVSVEMRRLLSTGSFKYGKKFIFVFKELVLVSNLFL